MTRIFYCFPMYRPIRSMHLRHRHRRHRRPRRSARAAVVRGTSGPAGRLSWPLRASCPDAPERTAGNEQRLRARRPNCRGPPDVLATASSPRREFPRPGMAPANSRASARQGRRHSMLCVAPRRARPSRPDRRPSAPCKRRQRSPDGRRTDPLPALGQDNVRARAKTATHEADGPYRHALADGLPLACRRAVASHQERRQPPSLAAVAPPGGDGDQVKRIDQPVDVVLLDLEPAAGSARRLVRCGRPSRWLEFGRPSVQAGGERRDGRSGLFDDHARAAAADHRTHPAFIGKGRAGAAGTGLEASCERMISGPSERLHH